MSVSTAPVTSSSPFISAPDLLAHWQGHRRLTRRVIDVFPEDQLLNYSVGSMRPFGALAMELISIAEPMVRGIVRGTGAVSSTRRRRRGPTSCGCGTRARSRSIVCGRRFRPIGFRKR